VRRGGCGINKKSAKPTLTPQTGWSLTTKYGSLATTSSASSKVASRHFLDVAAPPHEEGSFAHLKTFAEKTTMMRGFLIGLQFLTHLPIRTDRAEPRHIANSYYFYPVIGFLIGVSAVLLRHALTTIFPLSFSISLVLAFLIWISGGLHEDGLADVADGMGGGWTKEQRLTIMKDSRIGAFGASILILALLAKYAALTSMDSARLDASIVTAQILGRWAFLPMGYFNTPAREGLGSEFMSGLSAKALVVGTAISIVATVLLCRIQGTLALGLSLVIIVLASSYFRRRIGGINGDCFGATFQFVEIATYAAFLA
jgi:adenosylcobinamide-GDP ribazoletransferase